MARAYAGTVMLEGTTLSEGRGTTRPLELFGAPDLDARRGAGDDAADRAGMAGGLHAAADCGSSRPSTSMSGSCARGCSSMPRARGTITPRSGRGGCRRWRSRRSGSCGRITPLWRDFPYEYEFDKLAIDVINGGTGLRDWVDDAGAAAGDLDALAGPDEAAWIEERRAYLLY